MALRRWYVVGLAALTLTEIGCASATGWFGGRAPTPETQAAAPPASSTESSWGIMSPQAQRMVTAPSSAPPTSTSSTTAPASSVAKASATVPTVSPFKRATNAVYDAIMPGSKSSTESDPISLASKPGYVGPEVYLEAGGLLEAKGSVVEAQRQFQRALEVAPNRSDVVARVALFYDRQGKLDEAVRLYRQSLSSNPNDPRVHNNLGLCLARHGRLEEAATELSAAVQSQPTSQLYRNNLGIVRLEQGRVDEAREQFAAVHGEAVACYNVGVLLQRKKQDALANSYLQRAAELDPKLRAAIQAPAPTTAQSPGTPSGPLADQVPTEPATATAAAGEVGPAEAATTFQASRLPAVE